MMQNEVNRLAAKYHVYLAKWMNARAERLIEKADTHLVKGRNRLNKIHFDR